MTAIAPAHETALAFSVWPALNGEWLRSSAAQMSSRAMMAESGV